MENKCKCQNNSGNNYEVHVMNVKIPCKEHITNYSKIKLTQITKNANKEWAKKKQHEGVVRIIYYRMSGNPVTISLA